MLHTKTVEPGTLSLLNELMELPALQPFSLVDGTALALRYGHRSSIDLDLFFHEKFDQPQIVRNLEEHFNHRFIYKQQYAITYFVAAEDSETPVSFKKQTWDKVKKGIQQKVSDYLK